MLRAYEEEDGVPRGAVARLRQADERKGTEIVVHRALLCNGDGLAVLAGAHERRCRIRT
jgi:hypothetical protein